jgi:hypothetical protein
MPKEIFPSSYECDCGHQSHFFENTIREIKALSRRKVARLADSDTDKHVTVFHKEKMVDIICPKRHRQKEESPSNEE